MNAIVLDLDDTLILINQDSYCPQEDLLLVLLAFTNLPDTKVILWTHSTIERTKEILGKLKIEKYFEKILTRGDCTRSEENYGSLKSSYYLKKKMPEIKHLYAIDDLGKENMDEGYDYVFTIQPNAHTLSYAASQIINQMIPF